MHRRDFLRLALAGLAVPLLLRAAPAFAAAVGKLIRPDEQWKKLLAPEQYHVLREEGTEAPFSSPLLKEHRDGTFACVACELPLFPSKFKFDSGTGWPSFYDVIPGHVATKKDFALVEERTEYHCARCSGHHGHVFDDGPKPTGLRYCNNGVALKFVPA
ncbi:MAG: peptide-methionine (R)-S-oxide reductase MsrB [Alphaproteobacteria bacterium]